MSDRSSSARATPRSARELLTPGRPLDATLAAVAAYAAEALACRYALVALYDDDDTFGMLGAVGLTDAEVGAIESAPTGHGLLRELMSDTRTLRIDDVAQHPSAAGFPEGHPTMSRFLGRRLDGTDRPLGLLLLADPHDGEPFDAGDEERLEALAPTVEVAVENAVLLRESRMAQRWNLAAADFLRDLLLGTVEEPLPALASTALELADADAIVMLVRVDEENLQVLHAEGSWGTAFLGATFPYRGSLSEEVITGGEGLAVAELGADPRAHAPDVDADDLGPAVILPLHGSRRSWGTVMLTRRRGGHRFSRTEVRTAQTFADHATVALELAATRDAQERIERLTAEHRAAHDLHDHVVQRLFATGLSFQQALPGIEGRARERIEAGMLSLEETVQEIRDKILSLRRDLSD